MAVPSIDKHFARLSCCRPNGDALGCRKTREALGRRDADPALREAFAAQAELDGPMGVRVRGVPLPDDFQETVNAGLLRAERPSAETWRAMLRQPAPLAVLLAVVFLLVWGGWALYERAVGFPGDENVRLLVAAALKNRNQPLEPLDIRCDNLGDTLLMRHNLEDYEVPAPFAHEETAGYRVFEKNDTPVAQVQARGGGLIFLVFRADTQGVEIVPEGAWKHLDGEGWSAAVEVHNHICFVAISRGRREEIDSRLAQN